MTRVSVFARIAAAAVLAGVLPLTASAIEEVDFSLKSTQDLQDLCSVSSGDENFIPATYACRGFMAGAVQYHDAVTDRKNLKRLICYPSTATLADGRSAFIAWATANRDNKTLMGEPPVVGLVRALAEKYPCPK